MNKDQIESIGITKLREFLDKSKLISYEIYEKDKKPIWDGEIKIYKNENHSNNNFIGRIPIQVKSSGQKISNKNYTKFQMKVCDLIAYKNEGGVFLFYVNVSQQIRRIYFNNLFPVDLHKLLTDGVSQKKIGVDVKEIVKISEFENYCLDFFYHKRNQMAITDFPDKIENINNLLIHFTTSKGKNPYEELISRKHYAYVKSNPDSKTFDSVMKMDIGVGGSRNKSVRIGNVEYYNTVEKIFKKDTVIWKFGKSITMFQNDNNIINIYSNSAGTIDERLKDTKFFLNLMDKRELEIDGKKILLQNKKKKEYDEATSGMREYLIYLQNIIKVFKFFNLDQNLLDLNSVTKNVERNNMNFLIDHIVKKKQGFDQNFKPGKYVVNIGNVSLMTFICPDSKRERLLVNDLSIFEENIYAKCDESDCVHISLYIFLEEEHFIKCANLPVEKIYQGLIKIEHSPDYDNSVLHTIFKIIKAGDKTEDRNFYEHALKLLDWLVEGNNIEQEVIKINKLQIYYRKQSLSSDDYEYLIHLMEQKKADDVYLICIYILLGDKKKFDEIFSKMSEEKQIELKEYPIYNLIKDKL